MRASRLPQLCIAALILLAILPAAAARADDDTARLKDLLRSTTIALREAQDENASLAAAQTSLQAQLKAAQDQLAALQEKDKGSAASAGAAQQAQAALAQYQAQIDSDQQALGKWQAAYKQAADIARARDAAAKDFNFQLLRATAQLKQAAARNADLQKLAGEIIDKLQERCSVGDFLGRHEPVTQLYRVRLENLIQQYQDRLSNDQLGGGPPGAPN